MECFVINVELQPDEWKGKARRENEYAVEHRGTWRPGGNILNVKKGTGPVELNECGTLFPITRLWEAYGIELSNMLQSPRNFTYSRKHCTQLVTKEGTDATSAVREDMTLQGKGTARITDRPVGNNLTDRKLGAWRKGGRYIPVRESRHQVCVSAEWTGQQRTVADRASAKRLILEILRKSRQVHVILLVTKATSTLGKYLLEHLLLLDYQSFEKALSIL